MARYFVKLLKNKIPHYLIWSTVVDAPVSNGMPLEQFKEYFINEKGNEFLTYFEEQIEIADKKYQENLKDITNYNRAGLNEAK